MTSTVASPVGAQDRRSHPRKQGLAYVDFGSGNAGILSNLSECGLAFNGIGILERGQTFPFRFTMPGKSDFIQATGQIVWVSDSKKSGGLRFLELPEEIGSQIRAWTSISAVRTDRWDTVDGVSADGQKPSLETPTAPVVSSKQAEGRSIVRSANANIVLSAPLAHTKDGSPQESRTDEARPDAARPPITEGEPLEEKITKVRFELSGTGIRTEDQLIRVEGAENGDVSRLPAEEQPQLNKLVVPAEQEAKAPDSQPGPIGPPLRQQEVLEQAGYASLGTSGLSSVIPRDLAKKSERGETPQPPSSPTAPRSVDCSNQTIGTRPPEQVDTRVLTARVAASKLSAGQPQERPWQGRPLSGPRPPSVPAPVAKIAVRPVGEQSKTGRTAVLSRAAKQREIIKTSQALRFFAGVAVGCVALATIAGGLVATGKLRLVDLTPASSNAAGATTISGERTQDPGNQQQTVENSESNNTSTNTSKATQAAIPRVPVPADTGTPASVAAPFPTGSPGIKSGATAKRSTTPPQKARTTPPVRAAEPVEDSPRSDSASGSASGAVANGTETSAFEPPVLVSYTEPVYPPAARVAQVQGNVEVLATIGRDGVPRSVRMTTGDPQLGAAAIAAISTWRYRPATVNGQFQESLITIVVKFAL